MDEHSSNLLDEMMKDAGAGVHEMSDRDMACFILDRLNYESQLTAISDLLRRNWNRPIAGSRNQTWTGGFLENSRGRIER